MGKTQIPPEQPLGFKQTFWASGYHSKNWEKKLGVSGLVSTEMEPKLRGALIQ